VLEVVEHRLFKLPHAGVAAAANAALGDFGEQSLDEIQPTAAGGRKVHVITRMAAEPTAYPLHFVRAVIVHHEVDFDVGRNGGVDFGHELQEVLMSMPLMTLRNRIAGGDVQRGEQRRYAVAFIVV
jgi:hypothetical protein